MKQYIHMNVVSLLIVLMSSFALAAGEGGEDKTLSPYFLVQSDEKSVNLPLLSTSADVNVAGVIADVVVTQVYKNDGHSPIEAIYVFPASTRAAVYALKMVIGERVIDAQIKERQQARIDYETAKQQGKSAALLEQQRPNVFQMNVANILPGDTIKVELRYTELLVPAENVYEFVYPTVVGPRYSNKSEDNTKSSDLWVQNPYLQEGKKPAYAFDIHVRINAGLPIQDMICKTHTLSIQYDNPSSASVSLNKSESDGGNRDFILKYRLAGEKIESGVLLYKGEKENFFCMMVQPPQHVTTANIPGREYVFVVDVSGSMNGFPLDISKNLLRNLISALRPTDCFNVVLFAGVSNLMSERSLPANEENIKRAIAVIDQQQGGGGTELLPALKRSLDLPRSDASSRSIIVVTDGYVTVETEAFELIRKNLNKANVFAFGIGSSVNRLLIEGMAAVGGGEPFIVENTEKGKEVAEKFQKYIQMPVLTQVNCVFNGFSAYDVEPLTIPDVMASRPIIVYGKWKGTPTGTISISGFTGGKQKYVETFDLSKVTASEKNSALKYLWARKRIELLGDYNNLQADDGRVKEITDLGIKYNLLTAYTSFVAIDNEIRNKTGVIETIKQSLPLPQGVSNLAVGGSGAPMMRMVKKSCGVAPYPVRSNECMAIKGKLTSTESESIKEELDITHVDKKLTAPVTFTDAAAVQLNGKTIVYYWNSALQGVSNEMEQMIKFSLKNRDVTIIFINTEVGSISTVAQYLQSVKGIQNAPSNMLFVHDPAKRLLSLTGGMQLSAQKPLLLLINNKAVVYSSVRLLNDWSNSTRIRSFFK